MNCLREGIIVKTAEAVWGARAQYRVKDKPIPGVNVVHYLKGHPKKIIDVNEATLLPQEVEAP